MTTATEKMNFEQMDQERTRRRFEDMAQRFFDRWQPEDSRDAAQFSSDFFILVREIHIDAVEPMRKTMTDVMSRSLFPAPIIIGKQ